MKTLGEAVLGPHARLALSATITSTIRSRSSEYYQFFAYFNPLSDIGLDGNAGVNSSGRISEAKTTLLGYGLPRTESALRGANQAAAGIARRTCGSDVRWAAEQPRQVNATRGRDFVP